MFEAENRHQEDKKRAFLTGKQRKDPKLEIVASDYFGEQKMEAVPGTVYAELKLSDKLAIELKQVKSELRRIK